MEVSPSKRRVLGDLDANVLSPAATPRKHQTKVTTLSSSQLGQKRGAENDGHSSREPLAKRTCPPSSSKRDHSGCGKGRVHSQSPEASSIFDVSAVDTSQATTITEPDGDIFRSPPRPPRRRALTREEARQKAEILRLRLGLAGYKLRTGQEDVPLERLQIRGVNNTSHRSHLLPSGSVAHKRGAKHEQQMGVGSDILPRSRLHCGRQAHGVYPIEHSPEKSVLPRLPLASLNTPTRPRFTDDDEGLTSSAIRGGAAKGLLSLSRG
ncbi:hypothetical protein BX600DRAFT_434852 [Xylariales sp. PMI_506]|nr:hypothetical protein BX600DRAFT_434852 [Xylariales sp. PMI_506]